VLTTKCEELLKTCNNGSQDRGQAVQQHCTAVKMDQRSNSRTGIENWKVLDKLKEPNTKQLILLVDWDFAEASKETNYKTFTGLSEETSKVTLNMNL
jgi:hypothetical protein